MNFTPRRLVFWACLAVTAFAMAFLFAPDYFINGIIKTKNIESFERAFPNYTLSIGNLHYKTWINRLECDSVELKARDGRFTCRLGAASIGGVGWIELLVGQALKSDNFESSRLLVGRVKVEYPKSGYELYCDRLGLSVPDSSIRVDSLVIIPAGGDEEFFARSKTRQSRYRLLVPRGHVSGTDCRGIIDTRIFCGRHATIEDPMLDVLLNREKPSAGGPPKPMMPNEILTSIKETLQVDSLSLTNASIRYGERFAVGGKPAVITLDGINVSVGGLENVSKSRGAAVLRADGRIMNSGRLNVTMAIPLSTPEFSFRYSGSLGPMDATRFNAYLEPSQHVRLKSGDLKEATFDIEVNSGHATGTVRAIYSDLNVAVLDKETGREGGFKNKLTSFLANKLKIRNDNLPDDDGEVKIGRVDYRRQPGDPIFKFLWFALRSGVADVAGF